MQQLKGTLKRTHGDVFEADQQLFAGMDLESDPPGQADAVFAMRRVVENAPEWQSSCAVAATSHARIVTERAWL